MTDTMIANGHVPSAEHHGGPRRRLQRRSRRTRTRSRPPSTTEYKPSTATCRCCCAGDRWTIIVEARGAAGHQTVNNDARVIIGSTDPNAIVPQVIDPDMSNNMSMQSIEVIDERGPRASIKRAANNLTLGSFGGPAQMDRLHPQPRAERGRQRALLRHASGGRRSARPIANATLTIQDINAQAGARQLHDRRAGSTRPTCMRLRPRTTIGFDRACRGSRSRAASIIIDAVLDPSYSDERALEPERHS